MANILLTGASGYLGGDLFDLLQTYSLPQHGTIYALVRSEEQAEQVKKLYNAEPLSLDLENGEVVTETLLTKEISIVFSLIDAFNVHTQSNFLKGLAAVSQQLKVQTHFLHTSGAKLFSSFAGHPTDRVLSDAEDGLFAIQKTAKPQFDLMQTAVNTNSSVIEEGEALGVKTYIFIPCIVYGESAGFGNRISIQTRCVIQAGKALRRVHKPDNLNATWPVSEVRDNSKLYAQLLSKILSNDDIPHNRNGYYLAASGSVAWNDIYAAVAQALYKRGFVDSKDVAEVSTESLEQAGKALGVPPQTVSLQMGGKCTLQADNGRKIGWKADHQPEHILEALDDEVELILRFIRCLILEENEE